MTPGRLVYDDVFDHRVQPCRDSVGDECDRADDRVAARSQTGDEQGAAR